MGRLIRSCWHYKIPRVNTVKLPPVSPLVFSCYVSTPGLSHVDNSHSEIPRSQRTCPGGPCSDASLTRLQDCHGYWPRRGQLFQLRPTTGLFQYVPLAAVASAFTVTWMLMPKSPIMFRIPKCLPCASHNSIELCFSRRQRKSVFPPLQLFRRHSPSTATPPDVLSLVPPHPAWSEPVQTTTSRVIHWNL